jgi:long-chain acyl-CoA synthetase
VSHMSWDSLVPTLGLLRSRARTVPYQAYIVQDDIELSYGAADGLADSLADTLFKQYGVRPGDRVVCASVNGAAFAIVMAAVHRASAIFVPVPARRRGGQLTSVIQDCEPVLTVTTSPTVQPHEVDVMVSYHNTETRSACDVTDMRTGRLTRVAPSGHDGHQPHGPSTETAPSMILYSSGSTGAPKGVVVSHANQRSALWSVVEYLRLAQGSRILQAVQPAFDYGLYQYLIAIAVLGTLDVCPDMILVDDMTRRLEDQRLSVFPLLPTIARRLRAFLSGRPAVFPHIDVVTSTGSALDPESITFLTSAFPNARIFSMYGLAECKRVSYLDPDLLRTKPQSVGRPMPNCEAVLLNTDGEQVLTGEVGELFVRGPNVALGYWNNPDASAKTFRRQPLDGTVLLSTGDYFKCDADGDLFFIGRRDDVVKIHDQRVSLVEVEGVLRSITGIVDAVVATELDGGEPTLVAYVQGRYRLMPAVMSREFRKRGLPTVMIPRHFVQVDNLELTDTGKASRHQNRAATAEQQIIGRPKESSE